ncbi:MAG: hypothetical protein ACKVKH_12075 [Verrucomicrobiales bacterium]
MSILQIDQLRRQLREKFPAAHRASIPISAPPPAQAPLEFSLGHLSEIISPRQSAGASLVISELLAEKRDLPLALIDGRDTFDPASYGNEKCRRLVWVRCSKTEQAIQCADLLLRDGNLPLILLDLHLVSERELRQIPTALWHRLKIQARDSGAALVALTPRPLVPTPHRRLTLAGRFSLDHFELKSPPLQLHNAESQQLTGKA